MSQDKGKVNVSRRPVLKLRLFVFQIVVLTAICLMMSTSELNRWRKLSETHINSKGVSLVRTIEPHVMRFIEENNLPGLKSLAQSLTSSTIPHNDVISVQILDGSLQKLAESSNEAPMTRGGLTHLPATVVVANPIFDPRTNQPRGTLRMVFSNRYFEEKSQEVVNSSVVYYIIGMLMALLSTWLLSRMVQTPVDMLAEAAIRMSEGEGDVRIEIDADNEIGVLVESFNQMSTRINQHLTELRHKNLNLEHKVYELSTLQHIGRSLSSILDQEMVYETIVDNVINVLSGVKR